MAVCFTSVVDRELQNELWHTLDANATCSLRSKQPGKCASNLAHYTDTCGTQLVLCKEVAPLRKTLPGWFPFRSFPLLASDAGRREPVEA